MFVFDTAAATLRGGSFTGHGGIYTRGIYNADSDTKLDAESVTALAENGISNYGLENRNGAAAMLRGGAFTGRGGTTAHGIYNVFNGAYGATLQAESITALGENGSNTNRGLFNATAATLHGGTFTGRGGTETAGINNAGSNTTLEAAGITALGENGSSINRGLLNENGATTTADSSQFTGSSDGLYLNGGTVYLGVSQLDNGATNSSGTLTCFQVYDGNYAAYTCP